MDITLSKDNENFINGQIAKGIYKTINEAINALIHRSAQDFVLSQDEIDQLNNDIEKGWQDMEEGRVYDGKEVFEELKRKYG